MRHVAPTADSIRGSVAGLPIGGPGCEVAGEKCGSEAVALRQPAFEAYRPLIYGVPILAGARATRVGPESSSTLITLSVIQQSSHGGSACFDRTKT